MAQILVFGERTSGGGPAAVTAELLGAASRLNEALGGDGVACALIGDDPDALAQAAIAAGAAMVYTAQDAALAQYQTDTYVPVAAAIVEQAAPSVILLGQTSMGRDLAPGLATRLGSAVAMDALELAADGDRVKVTRSCYGGGARQVVTVQSDPQVVTVRAKSQDPLPEDASRSGSVVAVDAAVGEARARVVGKETADTSGVRLEDATVVVSGWAGPGRGRGLCRSGAHRGRSGSRRGRQPRRLRPGLVPAQPAGGADRDRGLPGALRRHRDQRRQPAHGRLRGQQEHHCD